MADVNEHRPIRLPATLLGIGLGGAVDGIVLHQLLQWHHLLTSTGRHPATTVVGLEANTVADGLFHVVAYAFVIAGVAMLWSRTRRPIAQTWRSLVGYGAVGWGLFNLVEGVVDHHLLELHHVREVADPLPYDLAFLAVGATLLLAGWMVARSDRSTPSRARSSSTDPPRRPSKR